MAPGDARRATKGGDSHRHRVRLIARLCAFAVLALAACTHHAPARQVHLGPKVPARVRRVVTLAPSLTELVLALGAGADLVGVSRYDDAAAVANLPRVGGYSDPSAETIVRLHPDLVLAQPSPGNHGAVEMVAASGIAVEAFRLESIADIEFASVRIGKLLGRAPAGQTLVRTIEAARSLARAAAKKRGKRVRVALLFDTNPLIAAGPGSFADELLADAGGTNVVARSTQPFPEVPLDALLARKPELILVAPMGKNANALAGLPPVLRAKAVALTSPGILHPGPKIIDALAELTRVFDQFAGVGK